MFFWSIDVPAISQIDITKLLVKLIDEFCVVYFDLFKYAYIIYSTRQKYIKTIQNFSLYVNQNKYVFFITDFFFKFHGIYRQRVNKQT